MKTLLNTTLLVTVLLLFAFAPVQAQRDDQAPAPEAPAPATIKPKMDVNRMKVSIGANRTSIDVGAVNDELAAYGLPELNKDIYMMEFNFIINGGHSVFSDVSGGFHYDEDDMPEYKTETQIGQFAANINYKVIKKNRHLLYPGIGFGWLDMAYKIDRKSELPATFPEGLESFSGERTFRAKFTYFINLRLRYDWSITQTDDMRLGAQIGYRLALNERDWQIANNNVERAPSINGGGFYAGLTFTVQ